MALKMHPSHIVHPGDWLRSEIVEANSVMINTLADKFKVSRQAISALLNGRAALTADMAIRFEKAFGVKADILMRMQTAYDMKRARLHEASLEVESLVAA